MVDTIILGCQFFLALGFVISRKFFWSLLFAIHIDGELGSGWKGVIKRGANSFELCIIIL